MPLLGTRSLLEAIAWADETWMPGPPRVTPTAHDHVAPQSRPTAATDDLSAYDDPPRGA